MPAARCVMRCDGTDGARKRKKPSARASHWTGGRVGEALRLARLHRLKMQPLTVLASGPPSSLFVCSVAAEAGMKGFLS